jgi:hypothetical protein
MQKNKIFIAAGTLALAIAGFMTTKANSKKFAAAVTAYFRVNGAGTAIYTLFKGIATGSPHNLTLVNTGKTAFFKTAGIAGSTVFAVKSGAPAVLSQTVFIK